MMYSGIWREILGITTTALIYEPANHGLEKDGIVGPILSPILKNYPYGEIGMQEKTGILSFVPFLSASGLTRNLSFNKVINRGNWENFQIKDEDIYWYIVNLFASKKGIEDYELSIAEAQSKIKDLCSKIYI